MRRLSPLSIILVPCNASYQLVGLGTCPQALRFSIPVFQTNRFTYLPWITANTPTVNISAPNILIPADFNFDNYQFCEERKLCDFTLSLFIRFCC